MTCQERTQLKTGTHPRSSTLWQETNHLGHDLCLSGSVLFFSRIFYLFGRYSNRKKGMKGGERWNKIALPSAGSLPDGCNSQCWFMPKPEAQNSIWVCQMAGRAQALGPSSVLFPGNLDWRRAASTLMWDIILTSCITKPAPQGLQ